MKDITQPKPKKKKLTKKDYIGGIVGIFVAVVINTFFMAKSGRGIGFIPMIIIIGVVAWVTKNML